MQTEMSQRYRKFKRGWGVYHVYDNTTGLSKSLDTRSKQDADRLVHAMNEAERQPILNRQIAQAYLMASDPQALTRTWRFVMDEKVKTVSGGTKERWLTANRDHAFDPIRSLTLIETRPEHLLAVLEAGGVATNVFLRKLHNFALDMNWLQGPVVVKAKWPRVKYPPKRAITEDEHRRICEREQNAERRAFFGVLWHTGASQTDAAFMDSANVDLGGKLLTYHPTFLGEYAARQEARQRLFGLSLIAVIGMLALLQADFQSARVTALVALTLPFALIGGVFAAWWGSGVLSLGSLIGFVTVLGIAARNGILLVSHYRHLELEEAEPFGPNLILRGAEERLVPILMTAGCAALALLPLVIKGNVPGHEIEYPMAVVSLGGLVTSTMLNLLLLPALYGEVMGNWVSKLSKPHATN